MTEPIRLLYLLPAEAFGGAERQGLLHIAELPRHGVHVTALVGPGMPVQRALSEAGAPAAELTSEFPSRTHAHLSAAGNALYFARWLAAYRRSVREVERRARREHFDLVFANRTFAWLVAAAVSRKLGLPYVIRAGSRPTHAAFAPGLRMLHRVAPASGLVSNCRAVERELSPALRCPSWILPNAVDTERFSRGSAEDARRRLGLPHDRPLVGLAARPAPEKGFELFSRVVGRVLADEPRALFVIAGEFGWRPHYERTLSRARMDHAVRFLGHVDAMPDFYRAMDVVVLTSRAKSIEGSPNALLEAMAAERPVVATAVGGVPELVRPGREGFLTADEDDVGFASLVELLLHDPELRARLGRAGRARVVEQHGVQRVVAELARVLRVVVTSSVLSREPEGGLSCASITPSAPLSTSSSAEHRWKRSSSSPGAAT
jgi:glycosyltransferase involved in cell wall biosynthesis